MSAKIKLILLITSMALLASCKVDNRLPERPQQSNVIQRSFETKSEHEPELEYEIGIENEFELELITMFFQDAKIPEHLHNRFTAAIIGNGNA
ncbi:MAG: hypothetical protein FWH57_10370 [Oscillospiraceae bacterium]|nr:hypothetical protein [Oscillospiraceae bacterium]